MIVNDGRGQGGRAPAFGASLRITACKFDFWILETWPLRCTISVFNGPAPQLLLFTTRESEIDAVAKWLNARRAENISLKTMALIVRSADELPRAKAALSLAGIPFRLIDERAETGTGQVALCTMHLAKGLEFRVVAIMACDEDVIPSEKRIAQVSDEGDLMDVYNTERHLLYVAATRARDQLFITGVKPGSEFFEDLIRPILNPKAVEK